MKVIIAGSRGIVDYAVHYVIKAIKDSKFDVTEVVSGGARGIDWCGEQWAKANDVPIAKFPADWKTQVEFCATSKWPITQTP